MGARAAVVLVCVVGFGGGAVTAGCETNFTAGSGSSSGGGGQTVGPSTSGSTSSGTGVTCSMGDPTVCGSSAYCLIGPNCGVADGHCTAFPTASAEADPLCGCDGVTYWNGTVASGHAASIRFRGECGSQAGHMCTAGQCDPTDDRAKCDINVSEPQCLTQTQGYCWVLPQNCPSKGVGGFACPVGTTCSTVCSLIEAEMPWTTPATACVP